MKLPVSENLYNLAVNCPFTLYAVGGYVRDFLAGLKTDKKDIDICAPVDAETFIKIALSLGANVSSVYKNTGTVKLSYRGEEYEFASFRSDEYVRGVHAPVKTFFTDDISLDARRRDFKCNAVYYDIKNDEFVDPLGGMEDINRKKINTVKSADKVFGEDGLRLMRLARQSAQTGFVPLKSVITAARKNAPLIADVSVERIYAELNSILLADSRYGIKGAQYRGLKILDETRVLDYILPELASGRGMAQRNDFHKYDVLEHSLQAVKYADKSIRLAALLHDIGKPYCMQQNGNFHSHETEGAKIAAAVCERFKVPKKQTAGIVRLIALHMYDLRLDARESKIRKLIVRNADIFDALLMLKQADFSACRGDETQAPCVTKWLEIYNKMQSEGAPLNLKQLAVRGDELISSGIPPAAAGKILNILLEDCALNPALNKKSVLIKRAATALSQVNIE